MFVFRDVQCVHVLAVEEDGDLIERLPVESCTGHCRALEDVGKHSKHKMLTAEVEDG